MIHSALCFSLVLHPLALKIEAEFPHLDLCVWYLDDGTIVGCVEDVHKVFELIQCEGPALGLHLNVKKEIWGPNRRSPDPFQLTLTESTMAESSCSELPSARRL